MPETPPDTTPRFRERDPHLVYCSRTCRYAVEVEARTPWWDRFGILLATFGIGLVLGIGLTIAVLGV